MPEGMRNMTPEHFDREYKNHPRIAMSLLEQIAEMEQRCACGHLPLCRKREDTLKLCAKLRKVVEAVQQTISGRPALQLDIDGRPAIAGALMDALTPMQEP